MAALLLVGVLFALIGVAVLIGGVVTAVRQSRQTAGHVAATGTVVDLVKRIINPGSGGVYCPVVEFTTGTGQAVRFESDFGTMPATHRVGQTIAIKYDPADPQKAEVDSATSRWFVPGCMAGMGLGFLLMGLIFMVIGILVLAKVQNGVSGPTGLSSAGTVAQEKRRTSGSSDRAVNLITVTSDPSPLSPRRLDAAIFSSSSTWSRW